MSLKAPGDLVPRGRGRRFWRAVTAAYDELQPDEIELLAEACRMLDLADQLRARVAEDGLTVDSLQGPPRMHPCAVELRAVRQELRRTLGALGLPGDAEAPPSADELRARRARRVRQTRERGSAQA